MSTAPVTPPPDARDWTFVIEQTCGECGFDPTGVDVHDGFGARIVAATDSLGHAALAPGGIERPSPLVWSPLEYAAHVRDVCTVFGERVDLLRTADGVDFANWDQDVAAVEGRYWELEPAAVAADLAAGATAVVARFAAVAELEWGHRGIRSNGSAFTTETLARYFLHDLEHHVHDVGS